MTVKSETVRVRPQQMAKCMRGTCFPIAGVNVRSVNSLSKLLATAPGLNLHDAPQSWRVPALQLLQMFLSMKGFGQVLASVPRLNLRDAHLSRSARVPTFQLLFQSLHLS